MVGGYGDLVSARRDFDAVVGLVKAKQLKAQGVILVAHDPAAKLRWSRRGIIWAAKDWGGGGRGGGGRPVRTGTCWLRWRSGAVGGAIVGKFAEHKIKTGLHDKLGQALPAGSAGIIAIFDDEYRLVIEQAMAGAAMRSVVQADKIGLRQLEGVVGRGHGQVQPGSHQAAHPRPELRGAIGRTIDKSVPDWSINMTPRPPDGAPNVVLVLIDDAGFGNPSTFGGPVATPTMTRVAQQGLTFDRFHVTALCSPTRAAMLTGRNHHRVGFGSIGELPGPFPGYTAAVPKDCAPFVRALQGNGYSTGGFGKWHMTPDHLQGAAGPFDRWPNAWGFDHFWGLLGGEAGQYDPLITQDQTTIGVPERQGRPAVLPARRPDG